MTPLNMARHRNSPHLAFWKMIKHGYDHFEVTHLETKVAVCDKRYVLGTESTDSFSAADRCPTYQVPEEVMLAIRDKQRRDEIEIMELVIRGTSTAPVTTGVDGGMNRIFSAAVRAHAAHGAVIHTSSGSIPAYVRPSDENGED